MLLYDNDTWTDLENIHKNLCVKKTYQHWIKNIFEAVQPSENAYKITIALEGKHKNVKKKIYSVTINLAKEICMIAGINGSRASKELKEKSKIARNYFILMEDLLKRNQEWWTTRNPQRANYKPMCEAISLQIFKACGRYGDDSDFSREANIINRIATGCSALEIKNYLGVGINELTRDNLENDWNEKIAFLQEQNILLLGMGLPIIQRVNMLISFFDTKFPDAKPIQSYHDREYLLKTRLEILDELKH